MLSSISDVVYSCTDVRTTREKKLIFHEQKIKLAIAKLSMYQTSVIRTLWQDISIDRVTHIEQMQTCSTALCYYLFICQRLPRLILRMYLSVTVTATRLHELV